MPNLIQLCIRCFCAAVAALGEHGLHALLQLALLPAVAFAAPAAAALLGCDAAPARARAALQALAASGFLEVRAEVCFAPHCVRPLMAALKQQLCATRYAVCSPGRLRACALACLRHVAAQALDGAQELWRMNAHVQEAAAKLSAELELKHTAARRSLLHPRFWQGFTPATYCSYCARFHVFWCPTALMAQV